MTVAVVIIFLGIWVFYSAWRFYKQMNWEEPPGLTPDLAQLRKREAELMHIQSVFEDARSQGKLSEGFLKEYERFSEDELRQIRTVTESKKR